MTAVEKIEQTSESKVGGVSLVLSEAAIPNCPKMISGKSSKQTQPWLGVPASGPYLRPAQVRETLGTSKAWMYDAVARGILPPFIRIGERVSVMPYGWLQAYLDDRAAEALAASALRRAL